MCDQEYLSIKEFAKKAGVTTQSIYKKLNQCDSKLQTYCNQVGNQRMLNIKALEEVYGVKVATKFATSLQPDETMQQQIIDMLQEQLKVKDEQIASLTKALEQTTLALTTSQALQANAERKLIEIEQKDPGEASVEDRSADKPVSEDQSADKPVSEDRSADKPVSEDQSADKYAGGCEKKHWWQIFNNSSRKI